MLFSSAHLYSQGAEDDGAKDEVLEDTFEDVSFSVDFACIYLVKELHQDKGVKDDGVVLRRRGVERGVTATVNVKDLLTYKWGRNRIMSLMLRV